MRVLTSRAYTLLALAGCVVALLGVGAYRTATADTSFTLSVGNPLFQIGLQPGETWTSGIQVVNPNPYDITVYAEPVLFKPRGDGGQPEFYSPQNTGNLDTMQTLVDWITVPRTEITIPQEQTIVVPLVIAVPETAAPGGHYAAVLIGNKPPTGSIEGGSLSVTSSIASLIFLRVAGDVVEDGRMREFSTAQSMYQTAEARFTLRFENEGNVHLRPQGDITVYNMFGKKRGYIPINQEATYGSVLPNSIRSYTFTWASDAGLWDIGRYKAIATVGFGEGDKRFVDATTYFYVLPIIPLLEVLGGVLMLVWFFTWSVKAYVRRALYIEGLRQYPAAQAQQSRQPTPQSGIVDLRSVSVGKTPVVPSRGNTRQVLSVERATIGAFLREYRAFLIFIVVSGVGWVAASAYFSDVLTYERPYQAIEERADGSRVDLVTPVVPNNNDSL